MLLASNILLGFSKNIWVVVALWGANGVAQSAVWCNMVRLVCNWFVPRQYGNVSIWLSTSMVAGSMAALGMCGWLVGFLPWRWLFWVPGAALALFAFLWLVLVKNKALDAGFENVKTPFVAAGSRTPGQKQPLAQFVFTSGLLLVTVVCLAQGVIKEGIGLWGPSMLQEGFSLPAGAAARLLLFIPAMNFLGIFMAAGLQKIFPKNLYAPVLLLMLGGGLCLLGLRLALQRSVGGGVLLLAATSALMYGVNAVLLSVFPLRYTAEGRVSFVSGFLDCTSYMGTGVSTLATGAFLDAGKGWNSVFMMWGMLVALGLLALLLLMLSQKRKQAPAE
ncbi:MAG: MFS transporter [Oscillospiraceae bacterium]